MNKNEYFPALTGIRAIASYMVFIHHNEYLTKKVFSTTIGGFLNEFHVGVTIFFVLSGFLITYRYYHVNVISVDFLKKYWIKRFSRIYPMYFILTNVAFIKFVFLCTICLSPIIYIYIYIMNITFLRGFSYHINFSLVSQGWSLTIEELFYLIAPFAFIFIKRKLFFIILLPVIFILIGFVLVNVFMNIPYLNKYGFFDNYHFVLSYTFFGRAFEFFIGIGLALFYQSNKHKLWVKNINFTYIGTIFIFIFIFILSKIKGEFDLGIRTPIGILINNLLLPLLGISALFYGLITEKTFLRKILSSKVMILLGKSSYVFYLIHQGVIADLLNEMIEYLMLLTGIPFQFVSPLVTTTLFLVLNIISIILFLKVEEPLHSYLQMKLSNRKLNS